MWCKVIRCERTRYYLQYAFFCTFNKVCVCVVCVLCVCTACTVSCVVAMVVWSLGC